MASFFGRSDPPPLPKPMSVIQVHIAKNKINQWDVTCMRLNVLTGDAAHETKTFLTYDAAVRYIANVS